MLCQRSPSSPSGNRNSTKYGKISLILCHPWCSLTTRTAIVGCRGRRPSGRQGGERWGEGRKREVHSHSERRGQAASTPDTPCLMGFCHTHPLSLINSVELNLRELTTGREALEASTLYGTNWIPNSFLRLKSMTFWWFEDWCKIDSGLCIWGAIDAGREEASGCGDGNLNIFVAGQCRRESCTDANTWGRAGRQILDAGIVCKTYFFFSIPFCIHGCKTEGPIRLTYLSWRWGNLNTYSPCKQQPLSPSLNTPWTTSRE